MKPVKISPQVEWLVLECVKIIGLDIAGVDLLIDKGQPNDAHTRTRFSCLSAFPSPQLIVYRLCVFLCPCSVCTPLTHHTFAYTHGHAHQRCSRQYAAVCLHKHESLMSLAAAAAPFLCYCALHQNTYKICEVEQLARLRGTGEGAGREHRHQDVPVLQDEARSVAERREAQQSDHCAGGRRRRAAAHISAHSAALAGAAAAAAAAGRRGWREKGGQRAGSSGCSIECGWCEWCTWRQCGQQRRRCEGRARSIQDDATQPVNETN